MGAKQKQVNIGHDLKPLNAAAEILEKCLRDSVKLMGRDGNLKEIRHVYEKLVKEAEADMKELRRDKTVRKLIKESEKVDAMKVCEASSSDSEEAESSPIEERINIVLYVYSYTWTCL